MMMRAWVLAAGFALSGACSAQAPAAPAAVMPGVTTPPGSTVAKSTPTGTPVKPRDCNAIAPGYRSRCLELNRVQQLCKGLQDVAKQTCIEKNVHYARMKSDCSASKAPAAKAQCLKNNQVMDTAEACYGKIGDALKVCAHAIEAKQATQAAKAVKTAKRAGS